MKPKTVKLLLALLFAALLVGCSGGGQPSQNDVSSAASALKANSANVTPVPGNAYQKMGGGGPPALAMTKKKL